MDEAYKRLRMHQSVLRLVADGDFTIRATGCVDLADRVVSEIEEWLAGIPAGREQHVDQVTHFLRTLTTEVEAWAALARRQLETERPL